MVFESKFKRNLITSTLVGVVPDVILSFAVASFLPSPLLYAVAIFLGLQALFLLIWALRSAWGWLLFYWSGRKTLAKHLCDYLHQNHFPDPEDVEPSAEHYLEAAVKNEQNDFNVRLGAAYELGSMQIHRATGQIQQFLRLVLSWETAIGNYKSEMVRGRSVAYEKARS